jgi:hypothetical protein
MHAARRLPLLLLAAIAMGCAAGSSPGSGDSTTEPVEASAARDGVTVSLLVDRTSVEAGGDVTATVAVRNVDPGVVIWQGGGCQLQGDFAVESVRALAAPPIGHVWDGDKNVIKQIALTDAYAVQGPVPPERAHVDVAVACTADLAYNELQPGEEVRATIVWVASTVAGSPAPAGDYVVSARFPYVGRDIRDPIMNVDPSVAIEPIVASAVVTVADHPPIPDPSEAMDAILADPAFTDWLPAHGRGSWNSVAIRFVDGAWVIQVRYEPNRMLSARRDPATGAVTLSEGDAPRP